MYTGDKMKRFKQIISYYESFLNLSNNAVFVVDPQLVILDASKRFCDICHIKREKIAGYNLNEFLLTLTLGHPS
jgi:PAS domain-containing protein